MANRLLRPIGRLRRKVLDALVPGAEGLSVGVLLDRLIAQIRDDHIRAHAGNLAFRGLFSAFAALVVTFALLALFEARHLVESLLERVSPAIPGPVVTAIRDQILATTMESTDKVVGVGTAASIVAALYGLSATARAVIDAMNTIYEVDERRPFLSRFLTSLVMALTVIGLLVVALLLLVLGPRVTTALASVFGLESVFRWIWILARWPVVAALVLLAFALVYTYAPAAQLRFRFITHGSVIAFIGWLLFSFAFSVYVENFGSFNATYGTVAGIAILILYIYFSSFILLIGAELNDIIQRHVESRPPRFAVSGESHSA